MTYQEESGNSLFTPSPITHKCGEAWNSGFQIQAVRLINITHYYDKVVHPSAFRN